MHESKTSEEPKSVGSYPEVRELLTDTGETSSLRFSSRDEACADGKDVGAPDVGRCRLAKNVIDSTDDSAAPEILTAERGGQLVPVEGGLDTERRAALVAHRRAADLQGRTEKMEITTHVPLSVKTVSCHPVKLQP